MDTFRRFVQRLTGPAWFTLPGESAMTLLGYTDRDTGEGNTMAGWPVA
ncbi:MAG TPA: hypothetical protein VFK04_04805 [Gemmatimonadaceae bacterium]|jgi:hypothetical protein|nr:hypothetical protein [Gemmatimonadaceae bacterium]